MSDVLRHSPEGAPQFALPEFELSPIGELSLYADSLLKGATVFDEPFHDLLDGKSAYINKVIEVDGKKTTVTLKKSGTPTGIGTYFEEFELAREPYIYGGRGKYLKKVAHWSIDGNPDRQWVSTKVDRMDWMGRLRHGEVEIDSTPGAVEREKAWVIEVLDQLARETRAPSPGEQNG